MKRKCIKYSPETLLDDFPDLRKTNIELYIDVDNFDEIQIYLKNNSKRFRRILFQIYTLHYQNDIYGREQISDKTKDITAMKFSNSQNIRIYCKEYFVNGKKIVMIHKIFKKTRKIDNKLKSLLETLGSYEYEF